MKKLIFFSILFLLTGTGYAQFTLTVTVTDATVCNPPCDGTASANNIPGATYVWDTSPVQTTVTATGLCPGVYSVTATLPPYGSAGGTGTVSCSAVGINNIEKENEQIRIFPNPAHNELYLEVNTPLQGTVELVIRNIEGKPVLRESIETNGSIYKWVDISELPRGMYDVEFMHSTTRMRSKFLKE